MKLYIRNENYFNYDPSLLFFGLALFTLTWLSDVVLFKGINVPIMFAFLSWASIFVSSGNLNFNSVKRSEILSLVFLVAWAIASDLWNSNPSLSGSFSYYYALTLAFYVMTVLISSTKSRWLFIGCFYLAGCFICALLVIKEWQQGSHLLHFRYTINNINANYIAYSLATAVPVLVTMIVVMDVKSRKVLLLIFAALIVFLTAIFLTGCRSALVAYCVGMLFMAWVAFQKSRVFATSLLAAFAVAVIAGYELMPAYLQVRFASLFAFSESSADAIDFSGRLVAWPEALRLFWENPIFGIGAGAFQSSDMGVRAHNVFLSVLVELGVVGMAFYLLAIALLIRRFYQPGVDVELRSPIFSLLSVWIVIASAGVWEVSQVAWFAFAWCAVVPELRGVGDV